MPNLGQDRKLGARIWGQNVRGESICDPNGIYSGMTKGLALDGEGFCQINDMPGDSRESGTLEDYNQTYNDDADPG